MTTTEFERRSYFESGLRKGADRERRRIRRALRETARQLKLLITADHEGSGWRAQKALDALNATTRIPRKARTR